MPSPLVKTATPGIYKRGARYVVVYRDPHGRQRKQAARTLAEARDVQAATRADVARGEYRALSRVTFADYAAEWIETTQGRSRRGLGEGTRADYRAALERDAIPFFGTARLTAIEPRDVKRFAADLADRGLAPASVAKAVAPVRALFADAVDEGLLRSNPAAGLRIARRTDAEVEQVKALTEAQTTALLAETPDEWRLFVRFLFETGLRIGEAIELRWSDVDFGGRWLAVDRQFYRGTVRPPKGRKRRRVRLGEDLARELWRLRGARADHDGLVFVAERGGRLIPSNLMRRVLKPAAVRAGLGQWVGAPARAESWVGFHTARHSCATALFRAGWNAVQVQRFLGHADPGFTLRTYVHLLDEDLPEVPFGGGNASGNVTARDTPKETSQGEGLTPPVSREIPDAPRAAEVAVALS